MSFAASTITFQNNPVNWIQVDGAYPGGIILGDVTILPETPTPLTVSTSSLTAYNPSGGLDKFNGHGFNYTAGDGVPVTITGPLVLENTPYFTVAVHGQPILFAFVEVKADSATSNAILEATKKAGFKSHFGIETTPAAKCPKRLRPYNDVWYLPDFNVTVSNGVNHIMSV